MKCCASVIDGIPLGEGNSSAIHVTALPQLNIVGCRIRWILTPESSDEGARSQDCHDRDRWGAVKALFWLGVAIGIGILVAGLGG